MADKRPTDCEPGSIQEGGIRRFVIAAEVAGYVLSLGVLGAVLYTALVRVEVTASVAGELRPRSWALVTDEDCVVWSTLAASGTHVVEGDPVCQIVTVPEEMQNLLAAHHLAEALSAMDASPPAEFQAFSDAVRRILHELGTVTRATNLYAPASGVVSQQYASGSSQIIPAGYPIAMVYDLGTAEVLGPLENDKRLPIAPGQTVRLRLSGVGACLQGEVWALDAEDATVTVLLRFENVPDELRDLFYEHLFENPTELQAVRVDVVLGTQTLFRQVFGRTR